MYIPAFWCGVIATIGFELIAIIIYSIAITRRDRKRGEYKNDNIAI